ncbi:MAG: ABC transporter ATP-binding protein [Turicibacter sp.]|nr:ABC transporter ATP-binding protein [Turicibacter sp.]
MVTLDVKNVSKNFGKFQALDNVSLQVRQGEVHGFIGPNGAGKSTTIRVILGILQASEGSVTVFGKDAWKDKVEIHRKISYVPGDVNLWPNLTGGEVIDLFMKLQGSGNVAKREELIRRFQLDPTKKCRTYSKGNRQKVALIAAFATDAELFILDEPTSGLDPLMEKVFHECVLEVKAAGKSVLLSSHILSEVEKLCDHVSIIRRGEIIESGQMDALRKLQRVNVAVVTEEKILDFGQLDGVHEVEEVDGAVVFQLEPRAKSEVMRVLAGYGVMSLEVSPLPLEDLFMQHYEQGDGERG